MSEPAITVLLPAFNAAPYIGEAIESILAQGFGDFELLIINDGSTDNTPAVIERFRDARIRVISRPNRGLIDTLNEGVHLAKAGLIARMDADDISLPQRLGAQYDFMQTHPEYVLTGADVAYIDSAGAYISTQTAPDGYSHEEIRLRRFDKCPFLHPTVMFRKEAVVAAGGYPKGALTFEDWLLWMRLMTLGKVCNLDEVLVRMRLNPESVTIDETWRPRLFHQIRLKALQDGYVSAEDEQKLREILSAQSRPAYKKASYHVLVGKKLLWDNPRPAQARKHLRQAIGAWPGRAEPYALWLLSWLPSAWVRRIYEHRKNRGA